MVHVVNHSSYHRGQVTTLLRQLGTEAVSTDFLVYYDESKGELRIACFLRRFHIFGKPKTRLATTQQGCVKTPECNIRKGLYL
jgi:hypothetical protein